MKSTSFAEHHWLRKVARTAAAIPLAAVVSVHAAPATGLDSLAETAHRLCMSADLGLSEMARLIGAEAEEERISGPRQIPLRTERGFRFDDGARLRLVMDRPGGVLQRLMLERHLPADVGTRPDKVVQLDGGCALRHARSITYAASGDAEAVVPYGPDLVPLGDLEPLNPPMPSGGTTDGGVIVALFDSGLAYTLPEVAARLVHDEQGRALGYDFWDMNDRPFDADTSRSPFFPARHGTRVASVLLREAPEARIVPFRYPRPDMSRMSDMVAAAAQAGARIVMIPMGSNDQGDWRAFEDAARKHADMLFVISAGNNNRNLDEVPVWPAALGLVNAIVVTSAEDDGRLARGSNWGPNTVDLMVPAENVPTFDYLGEPGMGAGTSYAVPRVAALAARILERSPRLSIAALKAAIFARAVPSAAVRHGVILDPIAGE